MNQESKTLALTFFDYENIQVVGNVTNILKGKYSTVWRASSLILGS